MHAAKVGCEQGYFGMAWFDSLACDVESSAVELARRCDFLNGPQASALVDAALTAANEVEKDWNEDSAYMFVLVRNAIVHFDRSERGSVGRKLTPLGLLFADILIHDGMLEPKACGDADSLAIDFESKWTDVRFGKGERLMAEMLDRAKKEMVPVEGPASLKVLVSLAWHLQKWTGKEAIYLPVNDEFAGLLGVTPMTISNLVKIAQARGYLIPHKNHIPHVQARTWFFNFGHEDYKGAIGK